VTFLLISAGYYPVVLAGKDTEPRAGGILPVQFRELPSGNT
jgi:hypothetical protein